MEQRRDFDPLFFDEGSEGEEGWSNFGEEYKKEFAPKKLEGTKPWYSYAVWDRFGESWAAAIGIALKAPRSAISTVIIWL